VEVLNKLAWLLATCPDARLRDGVRAVRYAERACEQTHYGVTLLVGTLAAAQKACVLARPAAEEGLLEKNRQLLGVYRAHKAYHETVERFVLEAP
jgi:hypothetical protein